jgi:hypothetical protein
VDTNSKTWVDMASLAIPLLALSVSVLSLFVSYRAFRLSSKQEERKRPLLVPSLLNAYVQFCEEEKVRVYAFQLSISNPSDSNNAIANLDLQITYGTPAQAEVTVRLPSSPSRGKAFAALPKFHSLSPPVRLDAHQTVIGWATFLAPEAIIRNAKIEGYTVALFDSHGVEASVESIMVQEYVNEALPPLRKDPSPQ